MSRECLDCALAQCDLCADNNRQYYDGGCCCGYRRPDPVYFDDEDGAE